MRWDSMFLQIFNMSLTGSVIIIAVILIRLLLKKAPKIFSYMLWFVVLFRLLCPITIEAPIGVITQSTVASDYELTDEPISFMGAAEAAYQAVGDMANGGTGIQHIRTTQRDSNDHVVYVTTSFEDILILFCSYIWISGIVVLLIYNAVQLWKLRSKLIGAVPMERTVLEKSNDSLEINIRARNIFLADHIDTPFVVGIVRPKVYLPSSLLEKEREYVILHEQHHIRRGDHIWKLLAFVALCVHWFNPLVWLGFSLYVKDMEMSCDEAVMRKMDIDIRAEYSESLLRFAASRKVLIAAPLAFGESDTMSRVKNVIKYKKPAFWGCVAAFIILLAAGVVLITNKSQKETKLYASDYQVKDLIYNTNKADAFNVNFNSILTDFHKSMEFRVSEYGLAMKMENSLGEEVWSCFGDMEPCKLTKDDLMEYMPAKDAWVSHYQITDIAEAYISTERAMNGNFELKDSFYLLMQTKSGDTLLGMGWEDVNEEGKSVRTLEWLDRLEITMSKGTVDTDFFDRLLEHAIEASAETFSYFESEENPGYLIVGFESTKVKAAHHDTVWSTLIASPSRDMGFAVFQINSDGTGYKLIDYHIYEDAVADNGNLIYFAEHLAVADSDGVITDANAFDVIFCIDDRIKSVVRVLDDGTELQQSMEKMTLLHWEDTKNSKTVKRYFLDEDGNVVSDYEKQTNLGTVKNLSPEAFSYIMDLFENAEWQEGFEEDNAADFVIGGLQDKSLFYYHSESGTFHDRENNKSFKLSGQEQYELNYLLSLYMNLDAEYAMDEQLFLNIPYGAERLSADELYYFKTRFFTDFFILDGYRTAEGEIVLLYNEMDFSDDGSYSVKKDQYIVTLRPAEEGAGVEYWIVSNLPF